MLDAAEGGRRLLAVGLLKEVTLFVYRHQPLRAPVTAPGTLLPEMRKTVRSAASMA